MIFTKNYKEWDPNSEKWEISQLQLKEGWDKLIKQKLNPNLVFVFSKGENPDWERQEKMMTFSSRYHLG